MKAFARHPFPKGPSLLNRRSVREAGTRSFCKVHSALLALGTRRPGCPSPCWPNPQCGQSVAEQAADMAAIAATTV